MNRVSSYLRQHHVGLLALLLIISGGVSYAAGVLPKNSVTSFQVKNNSITGKDVKNKTVKGTDVKDRSLTGRDIKDASLKAVDLDPEAVDEIKVVHIGSSGGPVTLFEETGIGKLTFGVTCGPGYGISSFAEAGLSPARAGSYGLEDYRAPGEAADSAPIIGAATVSRLGDIGKPTGGAGFGGSDFGFGQVVLFSQTTTKDVWADIRVSYCSARAVVMIDNKPEGAPLLTRRTPGEPAVVCQADGAAYCTKP